MSAGELESGNAGEPAKLIRQRYREASDIIKKGKMCALFINDLDAGAGRMGGTTQYTVNNQMVNATLMNIADNPTNVQLPGMYVSLTLRKWWHQTDTSSTGLSGAKRKRSFEAYINFMLATRTE